MIDNKLGISILIGTYNWDSTKLVNSLAEQAENLSLNYEIILLDDASEYDFQLINAKLDSLPNITYLQNYVNVGRSVIRNTLASKAQYPYLLFIDCDAAVTHEDYIKNYVDFIENENNRKSLIVVGGTEYSRLKPASNCRLRWQYGRKKEQRKACERNENPNYAFSAFNFLISKKLFDEIEFDESIAKYGHEDTLFGVQLLEKGITIKHIDNPLQHDGIGETSQFLHQTENSIDNLISLLDKVKNRSNFIENNSLLSCYYGLKKRKRVRCFTRTYACFAKLIKHNLYSKHPSIISFNLYKLNYLIQQIENK